MNTLLLPPPPSPVAAPPGGAPAPTSRRAVAVLGGGITGLCAAWQLRQRGVPVVVFESGAHAGGVLASVREGPWLRETGPNTLFENSPEIAAFVAGLGLGPRRLEAAPAARRRFIVRSGRLVPLPDTPPRFFASRFLSWRAKLGLLGEPFRPPAPADREESVAEFVTRRLGPEFLDYIVNPFVAGVYAGDPAQLSVRHAFPKLAALEREHGSLIRGALRRRSSRTGPSGALISFPDGLAELPAALARGLGESLRLHHRVTRVRPAGAEWRVGFEIHGLALEENFSAVICALPPDALARVRFEGVPAADGLAGLREIPQPPVASVFLGFRREDVAHPLDGFGMLTPAVAGRQILGTLFSSTLFPGRAPEGHVALTTFVGGARQPDLARQDDATLNAIVLRELDALLGIRSCPVIARIQRWPRAIPQYTVGYQRFKDLCAAAEAGAPGLHIGGTARDGVSLSNCITSGRRLAEAAARTWAGA
ncbi:MAG: protoporphyrinogen oxidase [Opitutaceae bacterium]|nr:protoporphyrinogen oxidase [Opitutaceae bacterium]